MTAIRKMQIFRKIFSWNITGRRLNIINQSHKVYYNRDYSLQVLNLVKKMISIMLSSELVVLYNNSLQQLLMTTIIKFLLAMKDRRLCKGTFLHCNLFHILILQEIFMRLLFFSKSPYYHDKLPCSETIISFISKNER